jgi:hypothetical protein
MPGRRLARPNDVQINNPRNMDLLLVQRVERLNSQRVPRQGLPVLQKVMWVSDCQSMLTRDTAQRAK